MADKTESADSESTPWGSADFSTEEESVLPILRAPAYVKNIFIEGLSRTKNELVTNQLERLFKTESFLELVEESNKCKLKLERLGIFQNIEVVLDAADSNNLSEFDVYYYVKELKLVTGSTGVNGGSQEGEAVFNAVLTNLRGIGESLKYQMSYGRNFSSLSHGSSGVDFTFTKPSIGNSDKKLSVHALKSTTDVAASLFRENRSGLRVDCTMPGPIGMHTLGWDFFWRENLLLPSAPFDVREQCGHSLKSALRHTLLSDGRDEWLLPSKGHLFKHNIEYSGIGGNVNSIKTDVEVQLNKEIFPDIILSASIQAGGLRSLTDSPPLINDRYFLGGPSSVRGFVMRGIGQHAEQASLGGELFWASGIHLYTPLPYRPGRGGIGDIFRMHFFAHTGNLANLKDADMKDFVFNPRVSFGCGLMVLLGSMARLELNYCVPKNARPGDILNPGIQIGIGLNFL